MTESRPRQRLSEAQRRSQIMLAAVHEVADRGYQSASLTRIAQRAGVAKGLVWHYFSGKDELMAETAAWVMRAISERVIAELDLDQPVPEIIRATLQQIAGQLQSHRDELVGLSLIVHTLQGPGDETVTADFYTQTYRGQAELFRRGQREGDLGSFDVDVMAVTYQGSIDTMLAHLGSHPDIDPQAYSASLAQILLNGMTNRS